MAVTTVLSKKPESKFMVVTRMFVLVTFPFILLLLPANFLDNGHHTICLLKLATGTDCYGCGMSRACMHLIHLDFKEAAAYNKISFIVLPILCGVLIMEFLKTYKKFKNLPE